MTGPADPEAGRHAYRMAGVDVEAGYRAVEMIKGLAGSATRDEVVGGLGGFAGTVDLGDGRMLVASTNGVGTKLDVARLAGRLETVGIDCVAMCANDVVCAGAEPLFFLDYLAVAKVVPEQVAAIVSGVAEGCRRARCALLGGETAEHPGTLEEGRFDLTTCSALTVSSPATPWWGCVRPACMPTATAWSAGPCSTPGSR